MVNEDDLLDEDPPGMNAPLPQPNPNAPEGYREEDPEGEWDNPDERLAG